MLSTNKHTRYVCCRRISLAQHSFSAFKFGYSVFALLLIYNLIFDPVPGTSLTFAFDSDLECQMTPITCAYSIGSKVSISETTRTENTTTPKPIFKILQKRWPPCTRVVFTSWKRRVENRKAPWFEVGIHQASLSDMSMGNLSHDFALMVMIKSAHPIN